ncbi:unnamed protein product [Prorocentrum cordatum]|uniref:Uncharacterized protein n=1 Tax=Prorocentrum cordatum TaxID=2364126 RepID=A0ABN9QYZ8_9DINO|nr:unnamed protein product [Polarella glacialis]
MELRRAALLVAAVLWGGAGAVGAGRAGAPAVGDLGGTVHVHLEEGAADPVDAWRAQRDNLAEGRRIAELDYKSARARSAIEASFAAVEARLRGDPRR